MAFKSSKPTRLKILHNIGATLDIPTGPIVMGARGETIINGGLALFNGILGPGNSFKSTFLHFCVLSFLNRIIAEYPNETGYHTYDTEMNIEVNRLLTLVDQFANLHSDILETRTWDITDASLKAGDEWLDELKTYIREEYKRPKLVTYTALKDHITGEPIKRPIPNGLAVDSLSKMEALDTINDLDRNKKNDGSMNTIDMRRGRFRDHVINQIPRLSNKANIYFYTSAHIGEESGMVDKYNKPTKSLLFLKSGDKIKGVPKSMTYLCQSFWFAHTASIYKHPTTKLPMFPLGDGTDTETDLNIVKLTQLRGKAGSSGYTLSILISQTEGVLPVLTEFYNIKVINPYGISGSDRNYHLDLYPNINLSRTTIRPLMNKDPILTRAINMTSELQQLTVYQARYLNKWGLNFTPLEIYEELIKQGYDWNVLYDTRGWMGIDNYSKKLKPYLSSIDLLRMTKGIYVPYWFNKEQKSKLKPSSYIDVKGK